LGVGAISGLGGTIPSIGVYRIGCTSPFTLQPTKVLSVRRGVWRTGSVFERYAIVSQTDISEALKKLEAS
jgi:hypothetical protein